MSLSIEQINKLQGENERLTKEVEQWKYEYVSPFGNGGIQRTSINSDKTKIAFIDRDEIVIIK